MALQMNAQRCAVLEFKARVGISQADVDGISAIFITYFRPAGYTMVERTQIDKVIEEQGFQRSCLTESQMVRIGKILNVSKIVVGDINVVMGQYNVDTRVINVETGTIAATEGATFSTTSYRTSMQGVAQRLASKIAIKPGATIPTGSYPPATPKQRSSVEVLYGYLKIFPKEIGTFSAEPTTIIGQINAQAQYGYNNWRIPTDEELSLMRANNYLGSGTYMTKESPRGIVLLVSDGKDYQTLQEEEMEIERAKAEAKKIAEQHRIEAERLAKLKAEQERKEKRDAELKTQGLVDLGLHSGTLWKDRDENGVYTYDEARNRFGSKMPTKEQWEELKNNCSWTWNGSGYKIIGPNGNFIILSCMKARICDGRWAQWQGVYAYYWSSTPFGSNDAWCLDFYSNRVSIFQSERCYGYSVRLVQK